MLVLIAPERKQDSLYASNLPSCNFLLGRVDIFLLQTEISALRCMQL